MGWPFEMPIPKRQPEKPNAPIVCHTMQAKPKRQRLESPSAALTNGPATHDFETLQLSDSRRGCFSKSYNNNCNHLTRAEHLSHIHIYIKQEHF